MGAGQLHIFTVPKQTAIQHFGLLTSSVFLQNNKDLLEIRAEASLIWQKSDLDLMEIKHYLDRLFVNAQKDEYGNSYQWKISNGWLNHEDRIDHDASLSYDENGKIKELLIRPYANKIGVDFIKKLVAFCQKYDLLLLRLDGLIFEPTTDGMNDFLDFFSYKNLEIKL